MERKLKIVYLFTIMLCAVIGIVSSFHKNDIYRLRADSDVKKITDAVYNKIDDTSARCNVLETYEFVLPQDIAQDMSVMVYSIHQNIKIYCDDTLVYDMHVNENNSFGKTPGNQWSRFSLSESDAGKTIKIVVEPVYKTSIGQKVIIYTGTEYGIFKVLADNEIITAFISVIAIMIGVLLIIYSAFTKISKHMTNDFWLMGCIATFLGNWKLTDLMLTTFLIRNSVLLSVLPFLNLLLLPVPFLMYTRIFFKTRDSVMWNIPVIFSITNIVIAFVLQIFNVLDLRQMLLMNHIALVVAILFSIIMSFYEWVKYGADRFLKTFIILILVWLIGAIIDLGYYYINPTGLKFDLGMLGFLLNIVVLATYSVANANELIRTGKEATHYKQIALVDPLTNTYSRTCFTEDVAKLASDVRCTFITFDLNDLKKCNDNYGHNIGDEYIKTAADIISNTFGRYGKCYRIGGDEFWVITEGTDRDVFCATQKEFERRISEVNESKKLPIDVNIAYGMAVYDAAMEMDHNETMRKADKKMYERKLQLKKESAE